MKSFYSSLLAGLMSLFVFSTVAYVSCKKDKCKDTVCQNGGSCYNGVCTCPTQYSGSLCETNLCAGKSCMNGGMCVSGTCKCLNGFSGENCEIQNHFVGTYAAKDTCHNGTLVKDYTVLITIPPNGDLVLKINGMSDVSTNVYANPSSSGLSFSFLGTTYEGYGFNGSGVFEDGKIYIGYTYTFGTSSYSCVGTWVKQ